jgi:peptidoglycan/xylan/chitin deacetylase (PgdA/CDA1 family)
MTPNPPCEAGRDVREGVVFMDDIGQRNGICVLTFHRVVARCERDHDITWKSFRGLLETIARSGDPIETRLGSEDSLRKISVALTFDDGTEDHLQVGEELAKRGMVGIFFLPAGKVGAAGRLTVQRVHDLHSLGHIIGSHSFSDAPLRETLSRQEIKRELGDSKALLEDALGTDVWYFAPPGGIGCRWMSRELERHGYQASRSMVWGIYRSLDKRWSIPCVPVTEFTLAQDWVRQALSAHALPFAMRSTWIIKSVAPGLARQVIRKVLHEPFRTSA